MNKIKQNKNKVPIKRLLRDLRRHYGWLLINIIMIIIEATVSIYFAKTLGNISDYAISKNKDLLIQYFIIGIFISLCDMSVKYLKTYCSGTFTEYSIFDIRERYLRHISRIPLKYLDNNSSAQLVSRISNDLNIIQRFLQSNLSDLLAIPLRIIVFSIVLFLTNWKLTLFTYTTIPILMILILLISRPIEKYTKQEQEEISKTNSIAQDCITGLHLIKSFILEDKMMIKYKSSVDKSVEKGIKASLIQSVTVPLGILMQYSPFIFTFSYGGYLAVKGEVSYGALIGFMQILVYALINLSNVPNLITGLRNASAASARIYEILDEKTERCSGTIYDVTNAVEVIKFKNVNFSYNKHNAILNNLCFSIKKGETVAIVGPSGCGKSSIMKLIMGFYNIEKGSIQIYGHDINEWKISELRNLISFVSQDSYLFPESIYSNVEYGSLEAKEEDVILAAKSANVHDFVEEMPEKYHTIVGENGAKLSGGQKQRISIARAILKDAPILFLDEATSALDAEAEQQIQKSIDKFSKNKTTLIIAHRLSTIVNADRILVINNGQVVEEGTHEKLLTEGTLYSQLYFQQFNTTLNDEVDTKEVFAYANN